MCDAYENDPNAYIISYEEMFDVLLRNIHEIFTVDVSIYFWFILVKYLNNYLNNILVQY